MSPFLIQNGIQEIVGTPKSVKKVKAGALLFEVTKKQHSTYLLDLKLLANIPVIGKVHSGLNQSKGILFDRDHDLDGIPDEESLIDVPFKRVAVDIIGPLHPPTDKGNRFIFTHTLIRKYVCSLMCLSDCIQQTSQLDQQNVPWHIRS